LKLPQTTGSIVFLESRVFGRKNEERLEKGYRFVPEIVHTPTKDP